MLNAEDYPHTFVEVHGMRLELLRANHRSNGLYTDVKITPISLLKPISRFLLYDY